MPAKDAASEALTVTSVFAEIPEHHYWTLVRLAT